MITSDDMIIFEQISVPFEGERDSPVCCNLALRFDIINEKNCRVQLSAWEENCVVDV